MAEIMKAEIVFPVLNIRKLFVPEHNGREFYGIVFNSTGPTRQSRVVWEVDMDMEGVSRSVTFYWRTYFD